MKFDPIRYLKDYSIPFYPAGTKNVGAGWVGIQCPCCSDHSSHGAFNVEDNYYSCWHCGGHSIAWVIKHLENIPYAEAKKRVEEYSTDSPITTKRTITTSTKSDICFPIGTTFLKDQHKRYLQTRGFDPDEMEKKYHLLGTGPIAFVKVKDEKGNEFRINYSNRIIIPIIYQDKVVSYQGRDITGKAEPKYRTCPASEEVIHHKHILYNLDNCEDTIIVVEGALDVWRLGDGSSATFGIQYTDEQLLCLLNHGVKRAVMMYDFEPQAQKQARKLASALQLYLVRTQNCNLGDRDPAELTDREVWDLKVRLKI
jgi:DNA primase